MRGALIMASPYERRASPFGGGKEKEEEEDEDDECIRRRRAALNQLWAGRDAWSCSIAQCDARRWVNDTDGAASLEAAVEMLGGSRAATNELRKHAATGADARYAAEARARAVTKYIDEAMVSARMTLAPALTDAAVERRLFGEWRVVVVSAVFWEGAWDIWAREMGAPAWQRFGSRAAFRAAARKAAAEASARGARLVLAGLSVHHGRRGHHPASAALADEPLGDNVRAYDVAALAMRLFHDAPAELVARGEDSLFPAPQPAARVAFAPADVAAGVPYDALAKWELMQPHGRERRFTYVAAAVAADHLFGASPSGRYKDSGLDKLERLDTMTTTP